MGPDFLSRWDFFTMTDPSHGHVEYVDEMTAKAEGMIRSSEKNAYIGVDMATRTAGGKRRSLRLQSRAMYNSGLFIIDVHHMPTGCGTWPAFWMYGEDAAHPWPEWGEYDIIETLNRDTRITTSLHTNQGCDQSGSTPGVDFKTAWIPGNMPPLPSDSCDIHAPGEYENQGCAQQGQVDSAGEPFNLREGGTFAAEWDPEGGSIRTWFWRTGTVPADIAMRRPDPSLWGMPDSNFGISPELCDRSHFQNMRLVLDINLCGDLGGTYYSMSCPVDAATLTCEEYVSNPEGLREAFWSIRALDVYMRDGSDAGGPSGFTLQHGFMIVAALVVAIVGIGMVVLGRSNFSGTDTLSPLRQGEQEWWAGAPGYAPTSQLSDMDQHKRRSRSATSDSGMRLPSDWSRNQPRSMSDWSAPGL